MSIGIAKLQKPLTAVSPTLRAGLVSAATCSSEVDDEVGSIDVVVAGPSAVVDGGANSLAAVVTVVWARSWVLVQALTNTQPTVANPTKI